MFNLKQQTIFKNRKGLAAGALISLMMTIVIGVALVITVVQDTTGKATTTYSMGNDTINSTVTSGNNSLFAGFGDGTDFTILIGTLNIYNDTDCSTDVFVYDTDYVIASNGTDPYVNYTTVGSVKRDSGFTCSVYSYRADTYVPSSAARTILSQFTLLMAVVLLVAVTGAIM